MTTIPPTWTELEAAGYVFEYRTTCRGCGRQIEFWKTPSGRWMPVEICPEMGGQRMAHWGLCPKADEFRRQSVKVDTKQEESQMSKKQKAKAKQQRVPQTGRLFT